MIKENLKDTFEKKGDHLNHQLLIWFAISLYGKIRSFEGNF